MKKIVKAAAFCLLCAALVCGFTAANAYDISVRMDSVAGEGSEYVPFTDIKPVQLDSRTLVPARAMAEAAGMTVTWDQPTQTAILVLKSDLNSDKPIERFASKMFSMVNQPMPGTWPVDITASLKLGSSTAVIRYNFIDSEGDYLAVGTEYNMVSKAILVDDGRLMIPVRDSMEMFCLNVGWNQDDLCAYVSIPETPSVQQNLRVIALNGQGEYAATSENNAYYESYSYSALLNGESGSGGQYSFAPQPTEPQSIVQTPTLNNEMQKGEYIGNFKITHYCPCNICNGGWGAYTAWAGAIVPGQTIGVNPNVIAPLSWVYIDGYGFRRAEDTGSGIGELHIDVAVPTHEMVKQMSTCYKDVYRAY